MNVQDYFFCRQFSKKLRHFIFEENKEFYRKYLSNFTSINKIYISGYPRYDEYFSKKTSNLKNIPIGRHGTVHEVSSLVGYLCSEESSYITGQTISVDGGLFMY